MTQAAPFGLHAESPDADTCVIVVGGEADMNAAMRFNESFFSAARSGVRQIVADLSEVRFIDTTMLNALVVGDRRMRRDHGTFAVVVNGPRVQRVLDITGLGQILTVCASRDEALALIRQPG